MTSTIKVNNIQNQCGTDIVKRCGVTTTVGSGAGNTVVVCGSTVTIGRCGGTVALASGASQTGFGRTGTVDWQTGSIKTATFTAANGEGYFCNTTSGSFTVNLPAGSAGAIVSVQDYNNTFDSNALTVQPNGSEKINGGNAGGPIDLNTEGEGITLVYVDGTVGWRSIQDNVFSDPGTNFIVASGGTITECGDFRIHTFTGPGTFTVSALSPTAANNTVGYQVVAGGGAGGGSLTQTGGGAGGGGGGGFREGRNVPVDNFTASPLVADAPTNAVTVTRTSFPITVGAGGSGGVKNVGGSGSNSIFSTITAAGGGGGGARDCTPNIGNGSPGGSGGGGGWGSASSGTGGSGNTPPTTPSQGNNGGNYSPTPGGGGGAGGAASNGAKNGGTSVSSSITGASVARSGGGGGSPDGTGGGGGAADGIPGATPTPGIGNAGTANTGGGGGGIAAPGNPSSTTGGNGGSGIVIIRYKYQ